MGYVREFQLSGSGLTKENAASFAEDHGVKTLDKSADLHQLYRPKMATTATSFFWDRASNSVQPMAELAVSA